MPRTKGRTAGEGVAPYFRAIFNNNKKLLKTRSNDKVLEMWLADHPGYAEVPNNVKTGLANVKSVMRSKLRKRGGSKEMTNDESPAVDTTDVGLEKLEMMIDECLSLARSLDRRNRLEKVIGALRVARRTVVWSMGE